MSSIALAVRHANAINYDQGGPAAVVRSIESRLRDFVSVRDFGAVGDGVTDDTAAIQAAIDSGSPLVFIPSGDYLLSATLQMASNVTVECSPTAIFDCDGFSDYAVQFLGSVGSEINLSAAAGEGDTTLQFGSATGFSAGDLIHLVSVRNALSEADAGNWWLGDGTASLAYAHFAEFATVADDLGANQFRISRPLIFPGYQPTDAAESETDRTTSAAQKVTPVENARWIGGRFNRSASGAYVIDMWWAYRCQVRDAVIYRGSYAGTAVTIGASCRCEGLDIEVINDPEFEFSYGSHHGTMNRFKVIGSQDCGFRHIRTSHAAQAVDFTYSSTRPYVNVRPYCRDSYFERCYEGTTSHPGSYQELWKGNAMLDCLGDGLNIRGYQPIATGNLIASTVNDTDGTANPENYGVVIQYGGARKAHISGNTVRGFYGAFQVLGSSTLEWQWAEAQINITGNDVARCYIGLVTDFDATADTKGSRRLVNYSGNSHSDMGRMIAKLGPYSAMTSIVDNVLHGNFRYDGGGSYVAFVSAENNNPGLMIARNRWLREKGGNAGYDRYMCFIASITDDVTYPESEWSSQTVIADNEALYADADGVSDSVNNAPYVQTKYQTGEADFEISAGVATVVPFNGSTHYFQIDTEASAAADDLDRLVAPTNRAFKEGDIAFIRIKVNARDITIRDLSTSGASDHGFQTPGGADVVMGSANNVVTALFNGTHWLIVAAELTT